MYGDGSNTMPRATYHALMEAAREAGIPVVGHAPRNLPFSAVLEERQDSIDHMEEVVYTDEGLARLLRPYVELQFGARSFEDQPELLARLPDFASELSEECASLARRVKAAGLALTPTLVAFGTIQQMTDETYPALLRRDELRYVDALRLHAWSPAQARFRNGGWQPHLAFMARYLQESFELQLALTRAFHAAGVPILAGTDSPFDFVLPGFSLHDELALFVRAGLSPLEALRAATLVPARALGLAHSGNVAEGMRADLVLIEGDPLRDVGAARRVAGLVLDGRWIAPEELGARLAAIAARQARLAPLFARMLAALEAEDAPALAELWTGAGEDRARLAPYVEDRLNELGYRHLRASRLEQALAILRRNTELFPRSPNAWDSLGEVLWRLARPDEAIAAYERTLELDPGHENARVMIDRIVRES
jgi:tetratricopeptide (TPR) repeat protein